MNLLYIRAAIREATGVVLAQEEILTLLFEEGLITQSQANDDSLVFRGYDEYFKTDYALKKVEYLEDIKDGLQQEDF
tara:strand:+ start:1483 stop:1713 length:231 start_codon:yes stop_codon:yes gene_type:complete